MAKEKKGKKVEKKTVEIEKKSYAEIEYDPAIKDEWLTTLHREFMIEGVKVETNVPSIWAWALGEYLKLDAEPIDRTSVVALTKVPTFRTRKIVITFAIGKITIGLFIYDLGEVGKVLNVIDDAAERLTTITRGKSQPVARYA